MKKAFILTILILFVYGSVWADEAVWKTLYQVNQELTEHEKRIQSLEDKTDIFAPAVAPTKEPTTKLEKRVTDLEIKQKKIAELATQILEQVKTIPQAQGLTKEQVRRMILEYLAAGAEAGAKIRGYDQTIGGCATCLDSISGDNVSEGDYSFAMDDSTGLFTVHHWVAGVSCSPAENPPYTVRSDDCATDTDKGYWKLAGSTVFYPASNSCLVLRDAEATDFDENIKVCVDCTDFGSTTEDCDIVFHQQIAGVTTEVGRFNASGEDLTITKNLYISNDNAGILLDDTNDANWAWHVLDTGLMVFSSAGSTVKGGVDRATLSSGSVFTLPTGGSFVVNNAAMDETDLEKLDSITNGTQAANKAVVADANVNTGVSKVTQLHIGVSGSETQVTATAAELNYNDISVLGTGAASKAVVLSGAGAFTAPAGAWDLTTATVTVSSATYGDNDTSAASTAFVDDVKFASLISDNLGDTTTPHVLTVEETTNKVISNYDSSGADRVFTMPACHAAGNVIFSIGDEFQVDIEPNTSDLFYLNGTAMAADEHIQNTADTLGNRIVGYCVNINGTLRWMFYGDSNWVEQTP